MNISYLFVTILKIETTFSDIKRNFAKLVGGDSYHMSVH